MRILRVIGKIVVRDLVSPHDWYIIAIIAPDIKHKQVKTHTDIAATANQAIEDDRIDVLEKMDAFGLLNRYIKYPIYNSIMRCGSLASLKWLASKIIFSFQTTFFLTAYEAKNTKLISWFARNYPAFQRIIVKHAIQCGNLQILKYCYRIGYKFTTAEGQLAADTHYHAIHQWLRKINTSVYG